MSRKMFGRLFWITTVRWKMYKLAHILRDRFPWIWDLIGVFNSLLFSLLYNKYNVQITNILAKYSKENIAKGKHLRFERLNKANVNALADMFDEQPMEAFEYFNPHGFDAKSLKKLANDKSFLAYLVMADNNVVGYFFQRSFFWGKSFRGYMTDYRWRRCGINRLMNLCATDISSLMGLKVYGTISPNNIASLKSAQSANNVKIIEQLDNGDYYVQYLPKE